MPIDERLNNILRLNGRKPLDEQDQQQRPVAPYPQQSNVAPIQKTINWQNSESLKRPKRVVPPQDASAILAQGNRSLDDDIGSEPASVYDQGRRDYNDNKARIDSGGKWLSEKLDVLKRMFAGESGAVDSAGSKLKHGFVDGLDAITKAPGFSVVEDGVNSATETASQLVRKAKPHVDEWVGAFADELKRPAPTYKTDFSQVDGGGQQIDVSEIPYLRGLGGKKVVITRGKGEEREAVAFGVRPDPSAEWEFYDNGGKRLDFKAPPLPAAGSLGSSEVPAKPRTSREIEEAAKARIAAESSGATPPVDAAVPGKDVVSPSTVEQDVGKMPPARRANLMEFVDRWRKAGLSEPEIKELITAWLAGRDANIKGGKDIGDANPILPLNPKLIPEKEFVSPEQQDGIRKAAAGGGKVAGGDVDAPPSFAGGGVDAPVASPDVPPVASTPSLSAAAGTPRTPVPVPDPKLIAGAKLPPAAAAEAILRDRQLGKIPGAVQRLRALLRTPEMQALESERKGIDSVRDRLKQMMLESTGGSTRKIGSSISPQLASDLEALRNSIGGLNRIDLGPLLSFTSSWGKLKHNTADGYKAPMDNDTLLIGLSNLRNEIAKVEQRDESSRVDRIGKLYGSLMGPIDSRYKAILGAYGRAEEAGNNYVSTLLKDKQHLEDSRADTAKFNAGEANKLAVAGARAQSEAEKFNARQQNDGALAGYRAAVDRQKAEERAERQKAIAELKIKAAERAAERKRSGSAEKEAQAAYTSAFPLLYARLFGEAYINPSDFAKSPSGGGDRLRRQDRQYAGLQRFLREIGGGLQGGYVGEYAALQTLHNALGDPRLRTHYINKIKEFTPPEE